MWKNFTSLNMAVSLLPSNTFGMSRKQSVNPLWHHPLSVSYRYKKPYKYGIRVIFEARRDHI